MTSSMTRGLTFEPLGFYFDDHTSNPLSLLLCPKSWDLLA